jgi:hypothetical protein
LAAVPPTAGTRIVNWDWSDAKPIVGCEALLEPFDDFWRARPMPDTWFEGLPDETFIA